MKRSIWELLVLLKKGQPRAQQKFGIQVHHTYDLYLVSTSNLPITYPPFTNYLLMDESMVLLFATK
jgi:hypothetical protein